MVCFIAIKYLNIDSCKFGTISKTYTQYAVSEASGFLHDKCMPLFQVLFDKHSWTILLENKMNRLQTIIDINIVLSIYFDKIGKKKCDKESYRYSVFPFQLKASIIYTRTPPNKRKIINHITQGISLVLYLGKRSTLSNLGVPCVFFGLVYMGSPSKAMARYLWFQASMICLESACFVA